MNQCKYCGGMGCQACRYGEGFESVDLIASYLEAQSPQAAANKAAEEGGLPALPEMKQIAVANDWTKVRAIGYDEEAMRAYARQAIAADRASRQVANKAEVEPEPFAYVKFRAAQNISSEGDVDANEWYEFCEREDVGDDKLPAFPLYATPPATTGASTVLTDERISEIATLTCNDEDYGGFHFTNSGRYSVLSFARAIEREVAAQAGQVAVPEVVAYILKSKASGSRDLVWPDIARNYSAQSYEKIPLVHAAAPSPAKESK